jgi:hypothetical protein
MPHTPLSHTKHSLKTLHKQTEKKLETNYEHFWHNEINSTNSKQKNKGGNKLRTYNKLKQNFAMERYLTLIEDTHHRTALTQLRLNSHPLNIESLRGHIQNPNNRICTLCNLNKVENEFHLMVECPIYNTLRHKLVDNIINNPNIQHLDQESKTIWLLTNEDKNICKALGKYIFECFKLRKQNINQST